MKNTSHSSSTGSLLVGMAAGAALGAVGTMAATQNQRQVKRTARKLAKGAEHAICQLDKMVDNFVEQHMDSYILIPTARGAFGLRVLFAALCS